MGDEQNGASRRDNFMSDPTTDKADKIRQDFDELRRRVKIDPRRLEWYAREKMSSLSPDQNAPFDHAHPEVAGDQARIPLNVPDAKVPRINQLAEGEMGKLDAEARDESGRFLRRTEATAADGIAEAEDDLA